jgi:SAM-dependent methyltransferase
MEPRNVDQKTVQGFGEEWQRFDFSGRAPGELDALFEQYFSLFPWADLPKGAVGFDAGAGSGRWAVRVASRVGWLHCIDASEQALAVARGNLANASNCTFHHASVADMPLAPNSMDFGYSLGVLHHTPDTQAALSSCVQALKPGAPFLLYLYYALDNRPAYYRLIWRTSDRFRKVISELPFSVRYPLTQAIAAGVYWPLARFSAVLAAAGMDASKVPLHDYRDKSFYMMRNDALDRFGTRLEQRFTRSQIEQMMQNAGLTEIRFRDGSPYWCALGIRRAE